MKMTQKRIGLVAIVAMVLWVSATLPALAQGTTSVDVVPYLEKKVVFKAAGLNQSQKFQVKIQSEQGELLFSETFKNKDQYKKVLDFSFAQKGSYYIDLVNDRGLVRKVIKVSEDTLVEGSLKLAAAETLAFTKSILKVSDDKIALRFENQLASPVTVKFYDEDGHLLHQENRIEDEHFGKLFNLSKLEKGSYSMAITAKNYAYYYNVNVKK